MASNALRAIEKSLNTISLGRSPGVHSRFGVVSMRSSNWSAVSAYPKTPALTNSGSYDRPAGSMKVVGTPKTAASVAVLLRCVT